MLWAVRARWQVVRTQLWQRLASRVGAQVPLAPSPTSKPQVLPASQAPIPRLSLAW